MGWKKLQLHRLAVRTSQNNRQLIKHGGILVTYFICGSMCCKFIIIRLIYHIDDDLSFIHTLVITNAGYNLGKQDHGLRLTTLACIWM